MATMMTLVLALATAATAYVAPPAALGAAAARVAPRGQPQSVDAPPGVSSTALSMAYVPDGLSKDEWAKIQKKEAEQRKKKDFGAGGTRGFKSRSMQSFMLAYERGEASHLFPVDPAEVKKGKIALKDVPYMQRGGSWDNSDLKGKSGWMTTGFGMRAFNDGKAKKLEKNRFDDKYNVLKPSVSIFGGGAIDWTGKGGQGDSVAARAKKNGISADQQMWRDAGALSVEQARKRRSGAAPKIGQAAPQKKFFGLF